MKISIQGSNCSMGCMYAETNTCQCSCKGSTHGIAVTPKYEAIKCSPAAEKRCKEGNESGDCICACNGVNHGIYKHITNFEEVKISYYG